MNATAKPPADRGKFIWIGIIVVVVIAGLAAVLLAKGSNKDKNDEAAAASVAPVEITGAPLPPLGTDGADAAVGAVIPAVKGTTLEGEDLTIGPDGGAKVIAFVAHWCPHCQAEVPRIVEHLKDTPMPDDVELVGVSTGVKPEADNYPPKPWLDGEDWPAPTLADSETGEAATAFGLSSFPYFVAVDADGKVVARTSGEISMEQFDALVEAAQTGTAPA